MVHANILDFVSVSAKSFLGGSDFTFKVNRMTEITTVRETVQPTDAEIRCREALRISSRSHIGQLSSPV